MFCGSRRGFASGDIDKLMPILIHLTSFSLMLSNYSSVALPALKCQSLILRTNPTLSKIYMPDLIYARFLLQQLHQNSQETIARVLLLHPHFVSP